MDTISLATEVLQNYPEYSSHWIRCVGYDYENGSYDFRHENREGVIVDATVTAKEFAKTVEKFIEMVETDQIFLYGNYDYEDPCSWDSEVLDTCMQIHLFNEVIFG